MSQIIKPKLPIINWSSPLTKKLVYHLPLLEGGGSTVKEIIKRKNGTWQGTLGSQWVNTLYGLSGSFNGTDNYINGTDAGLPLGGSARTVMLWSFPTSLSVSNQCFFCYGNVTTNNGFLFSTNSATGALNVGIFGANIGASAMVMTVNAWNHIVVTYDGISTWNYFINGIRDNPLTNSSINTTSGGNANVGHSIAGWNAGDFLTGKDFGTTVWSRALSYSEIQQFYINPFAMYYMKLKRPLVN